jgi:hypothetical protein
MANSLTVNTDTSKLFIGRNRYESDNYVNNSYYDPITLPAGTVMGRVAATNVLIPCQKGATDGSQYVVGILAQDLLIDSGDTVSAAVCVEGDVNENMISFFNSEATGMGLNTVVGDRTMRDRIAGDTVGIKLVPCEEMTDYDNQ